MVFDSSEMGAQKHGSKGSGGGYVGGLLQLFDWNVKSRKKLFASKSDVPGISFTLKKKLVLHLGVCVLIITFIYVMCSPAFEQMDSNREKNMTIICLPLVSIW